MHVHTKHTHKGNTIRPNNTCDIFLH